MKFSRVYVEITNVCALKCSFCPSKSESKRMMDLALFEKIARELKGKTKEIALHVMGDPLLNKNLRAYLDTAAKFSHKVSLTTSGFYLRAHEKSTLLHEAVRQINISLNSFNKNAKKLSFEKYLEAVFELIDYKLIKDGGEFINLRLWNLDAKNSETAFNESVFRALYERYGVKIDQNSTRIAKKVLVHFDELFQWASLDAPVIENTKCYGLNAQIAILSDGRVTPCCFDYEAKILLGDANGESLGKILRRAAPMANALKNGIITEELCKRCSYRLRFKEI
ncbi:MAG: radical SAM protein [Campylobacteraceae bacterium]|jgi:radical SAM protein with 4Fe4S-binding SPASM domain|nr:radical SAM protein [Campylobacteraceae bacterium]